MTPHPGRAERFEMALSVWYRSSGTWTEGVTLNVSRSGALAVVPSGNHMPTGIIDFVLALPPCGVVPLARIRGTGRVARTSNGQFAFHIKRYRFATAGDRLPAEIGAVL